MPDSLRSIDKNCIFRETFESEQAVRRNGGVPTDVTFSKGIATFNGTSSKITYPNISRGTYSIRIVLNRLVIDTKYLYDFSERGNLGLGWCHILSGSGGLETVASATYVNGVATGITTTETKEIIIAGTEVTCNIPYWVIGNSYMQSYPINMDILLFEIYTGTLTANDAKNLYENKRYADSNLEHTEQVGDELTTNGGFDTDTWWIKLHNVVIDNGVATLTADGTTDQELYKVILTIGKRYKVEYEITQNNITGGTQYNQLTNSSGIIWDDGTVLWDSSVGHHIFHGICINTWFDFRTTGLAISGTVSIDNVSVKEVLVNTTKEILNVSALNGVITNRYSGEAYIELCTNAGAGDQTDWIDSNSDGLADNWLVNSYNNPNGVRSIVSGNGFIGRAQRVEIGVGGDACVLYQYVMAVGKTYIESFKYRSNVSWWFYYDDSHIIVMPPNTGDAISYSGTFTNAGYGVISFWKFNGVPGDYIEIDEVSIKEIIPSPVATAVELVKENDIYAMKFNGTTSIVNCGSYDTLLGDKSFKIWFKGSNVASLYYSGLFSNTRFLVNFEDSKANLFFMRDGGIDGSWTYSTIPYNTYFRNKWVCLAGTWTSSDNIGKLYYNGVALSMGRAPSTPLMAGTDIIIGFARQAYMTGMVGSFSIYDGILTAQEIAQMYSSEKNKYGL